MPNDVQGDTKPRIARHSAFAALLNKAQVIIIDEISMQDRFVLEYVDKLLREISGTHGDLPFGGKAVVIGGDWKQLLPVIPGKGSEAQFERCVKSSHLFRQTLLTQILSHNYLFQSLQYNTADDQQTAGKC